MDTKYIIYGLMVIVIIVMAVVVYNSMSYKKSKNAKGELPFTIEEFIENVGGLDNIKLVNASLSKVTLDLENTDNVNIAKIKELGASGIVEKKGGITFIFGTISQEIAQQINDKL